MMDDGVWAKHVVYGWCTLDGGSEIDNQPMLSCSAFLAGPFVSYVRAGVPRSGSCFFEIIFWNEPIRWMNLPSVGEPIWRPWMVYLLPSQADTRPVHAECDKVRADGYWYIILPDSVRFGSIRVDFNMDPTWAPNGLQMGPKQIPNGPTRFALVVLCFNWSAVKWKNGLATLRRPEKTHTKSDLMGLACAQTVWPFPLS